MEKEPAITPKAIQNIDPITGELNQSPKPVFKKNGQFAKGNGTNFNNKKEPVEQFRKLIRQKMTDEKWNKILDVVFTMAEKGNIKAIQYLTEYSIGKPTQTVNSTISTISPEEQRQRLDELLGLDEEETK